MVDASTLFTSTAVSGALGDDFYDLKPDLEALHKKRSEQPENKPGQGASSVEDKERLGVKAYVTQGVPGVVETIAGAGAGAVLGAFTARHVGAPIFEKNYASGPGMKFVTAGTALVGTPVAFYHGYKRWKKLEEVRVHKEDSEQQFDRVTTQVEKLEQRMAEIEKNSAPTR